MAKNNNNKIYCEPETVKVVKLRFQLFTNPSQIHIFTEPVDETLTSLRDHMSS